MSDFEATAAQYRKKLESIEAIPDDSSIPGSMYKRALRRELELSARYNGLIKQMTELRRTQLPPGIQAFVRRIPG